jgi:predicted protein tyrosine phosphatase
VEETASALKAGQNLLLHCNAGIVRTGAYASAVLIRLGLSKNQATAEVGRAGSNPETPKQIQFLRVLGRKHELQSLESAGRLVSMLRDTVHIEILAIFWRTKPDLSFPEFADAAQMDVG